MRAPVANPDTPLESLSKQAKQSWWLWGSVAFAVLLIGGLVMYRHRLYNTGGYGLPFLAGELIRSIYTGRCMPSRLVGVRLYNLL